MALQLHLWLEETAYFKMPKGPEQELVIAERQPLEKVLQFTTCLSNDHSCNIDLLGLSDRYQTDPALCSVANGVFETLMRLRSDLWLRGKIRSSCVLLCMLSCQATPGQPLQHRKSVESDLQALC